MADKEVYVIEKDSMARKAVSVSISRYEFSSDVMPSEIKRSLEYKIAKAFAIEVADNPKKYFDIVVHKSTDHAGRFRAEAYFNFVKPGQLPPSSVLHVDDEGGEEK